MAGVRKLLKEEEPEVQEQVAADTASSETPGRPAEIAFVTVVTQFLEDIGRLVEQPCETSLVPRLTRANFVLVCTGKPGNEASARLHDYGIRPPV